MKTCWLLLVTIPNELFDGECLPPVKQSDLFSYLVLRTSYYTNEQCKNYKSWEAYNQVVSGKYVVVGKVNHLQQMNDPLNNIWLVVESNGAIISVHCLGCKEGMAETCSHIASTLFYIECWAHIN